MLGELDPDRTRVAVVDPLVGTVIDRRYRVEFRLAAGGFGAIYRATHVITGRQIALKVLHTQLATRADVVARFRREGATLGALRDPHTIKAIDFGETREGLLYIAMELLQGESLYERYSALGPFAWQRMVSIARQVCSALGEAHALGIIHRDLKPTNIHLEYVGGDPDFVKVLDFGIAKILHGSALDSSDLTHIGTTVGTFDYMAPEQLVAGPCTGTADIFTLGIVMYEMISGERPFGNPQTPAEMLTAVLAGKTPPLSSMSEAPVELDAVIERCLDRDPDRRYPTVAELDADLEHVAAHDATQVTMLDDDTNTWIHAPPSPTTLPGIVPPKPIKR